ncbi:MAG: DUF72 domain-containing protein [Gemmatimonadaceae bacterium]
MAFPAPDLDRAHDPGHDVARDRAAGLPAAAPALGGRVLVGTASWTDPTLLEGEIFYPADVRTPEARLRYYATRFPLVEVDATYYALPTRATAELWRQRTPRDFTFNVKAHALMTGQPSEVSRLPKLLREALPSELAAKTRIYAKDLPPDLYDAVWAIFVDALEPLRASGKLGAVLMQYPRWFTPTRANLDALLDAQRRLAEAPGGALLGPVELRNHLWFDGRPERAERLFRFLADHEVPYVMVDGPRGLTSSVPPLAAVTSPRLAMLRLHGRRDATWEKPGVPTVERYRYLYDREQLESWIPAVEEAARSTARVHVLFNNCHGNYGTTNAIEFDALLREGGVNREGRNEKPERAG